MPRKSKQAKKRLHAVKISPPVVAALKAIAKPTGINFSEQIRRGIDLWLRSQRVHMNKEKKKGQKAAPRRARTRRRT
jgi:hypothetical protein